MISKLTEILVIDRNTSDLKIDRNTEILVISNWQKYKWLDNYNIRKSNINLKT